MPVGMSSLFLCITKWMWRGRMLRMKVLLYLF